MATSGCCAHGLARLAACGFSCSPARLPAWAAAWIPTSNDCKTSSAPRRRWRSCCSQAGTMFGTPLTVAICAASSPDGACASPSSYMSGSGRPSPTHRAMNCCSASWNLGASALSDGSTVAGLTAAATARLTAAGHRARSISRRFGSPSLMLCDRSHSPMPDPSSSTRLV
eukprot:1712828-Prymnesium_polylepis.1